MTGRLTVTVTALLIVFAAQGSEAQQAATENATRSRLTTLFVTADTPAGKGLVPTALAEARIAAQQARLAATATTDLAAMRQGARGVIHAVDPTVVTSGPGLGYGVKRALAGIVTEVRATVTADSGPDVALLTQHALTASTNVTQWANDLVRIAQQIAAAPTAAEAATLAPTLKRLARQLTVGIPVGEAPRMTYPPAQGGLHTVQLSLGALRAGRERLVPASTIGGRQ